MDTKKSGFFSIFGGASGVAVAAGSSAQPNAPIGVTTGGLFGGGAANAASTTGNANNIFSMFHKAQNKLTPSASCVMQNSHRGENPNTTGANPTSAGGGGANDYWKDASMIATDFKKIA